MQSSFGGAHRSTTVARSRRPKNGPKKQPQRGLGVAQLEKLRLQEQRGVDFCSLAVSKIAPLPDQGVQDAARSMACNLLVTSAGYVTQYLLEPSLSSWPYKEQLGDSVFLRRAPGSRLVDGLSRAQEELLLLQHQNGSYRCPSPARNGMMVDLVSQDLDPRHQQPVEIATIGTPSIGYQPRELSSFQNIHQNKQCPPWDSKVSENKRQRLESWLCLNVGSAQNAEVRAGGPPQSVNRAINALGSNSRLQEKPVIQTAWLDKTAITGLSCHDSLIPSTTLTNMYSCSSGSSPRPARHVGNTQNTRWSSSEPEIESSSISDFLTLGLSLSRTSSDSSRSVLQCDEDDLGSHNSFQGQRGADDCSSACVQPCSRDSLDLDLRLSL